MMKFSNKMNTTHVLFIIRKNGVRYIYYTQMFLLALAIVLLTLFMVWVRQLIGQCYMYLYRVQQNPNGTKTLLNPPDGFLYNETFCTDKVRNE
jgi:hypothetical protein